MGAVCVDPLVNEVMLAKTDATSLYNKLCCAAGLCHSIYSQLYNLSNACHQNRLMHIHMGLCDLAQRRSAVLVIGCQYQKKTLLVRQTNVLLLLISLELLLWPHLPALHFKCNGRVQSVFFLYILREVSFLVSWDVTEVVDAQQSLLFI